MLDLIVAFVLGAVCWEHRAKIMELGKKLYHDLVTNDVVEEPSQKKESKKEK